jgi:hypothetical protein
VRGQVENYVARDEQIEKKKKMKGIEAQMGGMGGIKNSQHY